MRLAQLLVAFHTSTAIAQSSTLTDAPTTTSLALESRSSSALPKTHTIQVGLADHKMVPATTQAAIGDILEFNFYPLNHSVVRADYGYPCIPYEKTGPSRQGFFSEFHPVKNVLDKPPTFQVRVNDLEPILYYCSAPGSCITYGMVGGVNLNSSMSIDTQMELAKKSTYMLQPGEEFPPEAPLPSGLSSASSSATASNTAAPASGNSPTLSKGAIAGIAVAGAVALLLGALLFFYCGRIKTLHNELRRRDGAQAEAAGMTEHKFPNTQVHALSASHGQDYDGFSQQDRGSGLYAHHPHASVGANGVPDYRLSAYPAKFVSPPGTPYHDMRTPAGSPPPGMGPGTMHPHDVHQSSPRSPPAPAYYDSAHHQQLDHQQTANPDPVEMEARMPGRTPTRNGK